MTTLRNTLFKILCNKTVFQLISINHRQPSKKCPDNKLRHFGLSIFSYMNQSVKESQNAPDNILQGRPDNLAVNCNKRELRIWKNLKKLGLILGAGAITFVIFTLVLLGLSFLADYLKTNIGQEPWLFVDSFIKPIALVFVGGWLWLAGKLLNKVKPIKYGRYLLILWVVVALISYFLSFLVTPNG